MDHYHVLFCRRAFALAIKLLCFFPVNCLLLRLKILFFTYNFRKCYNLVMINIARTLRAIKRFLCTYVGALKKYYTNSNNFSLFFLRKKNFF